LQVTAVREVFEETGISIGGDQVPLTSLRDWQLSNVYTIYPAWRQRYAPGVTQNTEHVFGLCVPRDIVITLAPREHLQHRWMPWREAADQCFSPSNAEAILQLPRYSADSDS
jgi:dATP pyrophosphohydrolase